MDTPPLTPGPLDRDAALRREFGPLLRGVARRYFEDVRFPEDALTELARLHERGFVVHVMRATGWINYLLLTWALVRRNLPPVRAVVNLRPWLSKPWRRTAQRGALDVRFTYARRQGGSGLIFLKRTVLAVPRGKESKEDPFPALVAMARRSDRPVLLVPELFVWERWNTRIKPVLADYLFGSPEAPGFLHSLLSFWRNRKRAQFRLGEPIDLRRFIEENPQDSDERLARKVRSTLHQHLARETRAVFGPPYKPTDRLIEETLRDRALRKAMETEAERSHRPLPAVEREARKNLQSIAARQHPSVLALTAPVLSAAFNRIYDGVEVDEAGLQRALKSGTKAPFVFCPSHKSHVDYLVLAWVLWMRGQSVPMIAAGANLSFFPLGPYLRRAGAFFLRRSFKGDPLYTASFKAYIKKLVHDGAHQEFFPEGGRSRTGKLLQPKLGILAWEVEAVLEGAREDLHFVPVSIDYEKVVESGSYRGELAGAEKKPEDLRGLLKTPKVLASRYGRIYISFDAPISLRAFIQSRGLSMEQLSVDEHRRSLVRALGQRIMYGVARVSTVTPHALLSAALLTHRRGAAGARTLAQEVGLVRRVAEADGAPLSRSLHNAPSDPTVIGPIQEAMRTFCSDGMVRTTEVRGEVMYEVEQARRTELSFYKNTLMNLLAPRAMVACALLAEGGSAPFATVKERALWLSRLFKVEFIYRVGATFDVIFSETVDKLVAPGLLQREGDRLLVAPESHSGPELRCLAAMLTDFLESYLLAALMLEELARAGGMDKKAFVRTALELGRAELLKGNLEAAEALSKPTLDNAVSHFLEQRLLVEQEKVLRLGPAAERPEDRARLVSELRAFLAPPGAR